MRWLIGTSYLHREAPNTLLVGAAALDPSGNIVAGTNPFVNSTYLRHDNFVGVYGQVNYDITHALEASAAVRCDQNRHNSTQYTSLNLQTPVPTPDGLVTQRKTDAAVQPKFRLSYHWTDDLMTHATAAKVFRSGVFYSGSFTKAESTWNYEAGVKSELADHGLTLNFDVFHINYSDQQFTSIILTPPYRQTSNIQSTRINGAEAELTARPLSNLTLGVGIGYTDATMSDDTAGPYTPRFTAKFCPQSTPIRWLPTGVSSPASISATRMFKRCRIRLPALQQQPANVWRRGSAPVLKERKQLHEYFCRSSFGQEVSAGSGASSQAWWSLRVMMTGCSVAPWEWTD